MISSTLYERPDPIPGLDVDAPRARKTDPSTSHQAAQRMAPATPALEAQILDLLSRYRGGLTKDGVCERLKVDPRRWPSVASALTRMRNAGKLQWVGEPVENQNVWALITETVETGDAL